MCEMHKDIFYELVIYICILRIPASVFMEFLYVRNCVAITLFAHLW